MTNGRRLPRHRAKPDDAPRAALATPAPAKPLRFGQQPNVTITPKRRR